MKIELIKYHIQYVGDKTYTKIKVRYYSLFQLIKGFCDGGFYKFSVKEFIVISHTNDKDTIEIYSLPEFQLIDFWENPTLNRRMRDIYVQTVYDNCSLKYYSSVDIEDYNKS